MDKMQQNILDFFGNTKLLKNIRTSAVLILLILIPVIYFGFRATFTFKALLSWDFGSAIVVITLSVLLATIETKSLAFDITVELDNEIGKLENETEVNADLIRQKDSTGKHSVKWCNDYNKEQQKLYDEILTNDRIAIYEKRMLNANVNGHSKQAKKYENLIKKLKQSSLSDKKFKHYDIKRIIGIDKIGVKLSKHKGNNEIESNPKKVSLGAILLSMPIRAMGVGALGTIPFMWSASGTTVFLFYLSYLLALIITIVSQYLITSYKTTYGYKKSLKKIKTLQQLLLAKLSIETQVEGLPFDELEERK